MDIKKIMVIGAGTMGAGIAHVAARAEIEVILCDIDKDIVAKGIDGIARHLQRTVDKGKMQPNEKQNILNRIVGGTDIASAGSDVSLVIEAATEKMAVKKNIFKKLELAYSAETILATNTSALSITELAASLSHPERILGIHFFNPAPVMELVELIKGACTSEEVFQAAKTWVGHLGKTHVEVNEAPGFIVNRILIPMINEAATILMEQVASAEDIDQAMKLGANHPIGPLRLGDLIGLDVCLEIMETLYTEFGDSKYRPCPLLKKFVRAGRIGRKAGMGFHDYSVA